MTQYINEENLGNIATERQARRLVQIMQSRGWKVEYGDSQLSDELPDAERVMFNSAFGVALKELDQEE